MRETACRISKSPDVFGILSEPGSTPPAERPTIVLLNAGSAYRIGPGRLNVELARQLTAAGFACLRMDMCGLGDSVPASAAEENDSYAATVFRDIGLALKFLGERGGTRRFVLMGLCSGAYAAFQSAAQLSDEELVESVLINPLTFYWCDGMTLETAPTLELIRQHYYLSSALHPAKWLKLLSGRSRIGIGGALRLVARRLAMLTRRSPQSLVSREPAGQLLPGHPLVQDLTADLKHVVTANRRLSMFFSTTDPGHSILTLQAGRQVRRMVRGGQLSVTMIDGADHTFSRQAARQELIDAVSRHLQTRYG